MLHLARGSARRTPRPRPRARRRPARSHPRPRPARPVRRSRSPSSGPRRGEGREHEDARRARRGGGRAAGRGRARALAADCERRHRPRRGVPVVSARHAPVAVPARRRSYSSRWTGSDSTAHAAFSSCMLASAATSLGGRAAPPAIGVEVPRSRPVRRVELRGRRRGVDPQHVVQRHTRTVRRGRHGAAWRISTIVDQRGQHFRLAARNAPIRAFVPLLASVTSGTLRARRVGDRRRRRRHALERVRDREALARGARRQRRAPGQHAWSTAAHPRGRAALPGVGASRHRLGPTGTDPVGPHAGGHRRYPADEVWALLRRSEAGE